MICRARLLHSTKICGKSRLGGALGRSLKRAFDYAPTTVVPGVVHTSGAEFKLLLCVYNILRVPPPLPVNRACILYACPYPPVYWSFNSPNLKAPRVNNTLSNRYANTYYIIGRRAGESNLYSLHRSLNNKRASGEKYVFDAKNRRRKKYTKRNKTIYAWK